ncbi:UNVERIFIED_ORG: hypothetical protein J2X79_000234 [Arthrobacter globiformis]|nr:hypothetical protein [Arthrobacter globiformis]
MRAEIDALDLTSAAALGAEARALSAARQWDLAVAGGRPHLIGTQERIVRAALDRLYALQEAEGGRRQSDLDDAYAVTEQACHELGIETQAETVARITARPLADVLREQRGARRRT